MTFFDVRMRGFKSRADVDAVLAWVDAFVAAPLGVEDVPLADAAGRALAAEVVAAADVPAFHRSAMDGWAVRAEDTFGASPTSARTLALSAGGSRPGSAPTDSVGPGRAVRCLTGAPVPPGADAILPAEMGEEAGAYLLVRGEVPPGRHVSKAGEDVRRGTVVLPAGRRLRPQDLGMLSALGLPAARVVARPSVALVVTGDEILPAGTPPAGHRVPDANSPMLEALVRRDGGRVASRVLVGDDEARLTEAIGRGQADVVLVTGASSVGPEDRVPAVVARLGEVVFHGIAMRPSSPAGIGVLRDGGRPVFLLPGNPVSCLCAYDFFAARLVRRLAGLPPGWPYAAVRLPLARKVVSDLGRVDYLRVRVLADGRVEPLTSRGASVLSTTTRADGFVVVPRDVEGWPEGAVVEVRLYEPAAG